MCFILSKILKPCKGKKSMTAKTPENIKTFPLHYRDKNE